MSLYTTDRLCRVQGVLNHAQHDCSLVQASIAEGDEEGGGDVEAVEGAGDRAEMARRGD